MPLPPRTRRVFTSLLLGFAVLSVSTAAADTPAATSPRPLTSDARPLGLPANPAAAADTAPLTRSASPSTGMSTLRTAASLAAVLGIIFGGAAVFKRVVLKNPSLAASMGAGGRAPAGILEIIGRYPVGRGASLVLLRLDNRLLLLSQSAVAGGRGLIRPGSTTLSTLCEITGADDVASILAKARDEEGESLSARFQSLLHGMSHDPEAPTAPDLVDATPVEPSAPAVVVRPTTWSAVRGGAV